jgi:two-component system response regulator AtoC
MKVLLSSSIVIHPHQFLGVFQVETIDHKAIEGHLREEGHPRWDVILLGEESLSMDRILLRVCAQSTPIVVVGQPSSQLVALGRDIDPFALLASPLRESDFDLLMAQLQGQDLLKSKQLKGKSSPTASFIAVSPIMQEIRTLVDRLAPFSTTVSITGESGTGKEVIARSLHRGSPRADRSFIAVNCGAIPEGLVESELFGHKKGAFTDATHDKIGLFEQAAGGTLFLDEIGELSLSLQVKLLRVLQEGRIRPIGGEEEVSIDVRLIAATHRDLENEVARGTFREDLFYRLQVVTIHLPPLRDRPEDIAPLADYFVKKHCKRLKLKIRGISPEAMDILCKYPWKGNVRELENCIERGIVLTEQDVIDVDSLPPLVRSLSRTGKLTGPFIPPDETSIKKLTQEIEITLIQRALDRTGGNRTRAAKLLEISHRALLYKLKGYGLAD